ncbi:MAG: S1C family serine protease [Betaproteobacteria bacterium]
MKHTPLQSGARILLLLACALAAPAAWPADAPAAPSPIEQQARALAQANAATVGVRAKAIEDARSSRTLGELREGSGVVIGSDGLVLTIGYLILEAEQVDLLLEGNRVLPARVVAYDPATGFGLVQSLVPLPLPTAPLGDASRLTGDEPLMIASGGDDGDVSMARMVARRPFSGNWEYHIDEALFTAPPRADHSGAGLFNSRGELVGIGSLLVSDTRSAQFPHLPGNMFVPVDLLKPILAELRARGESHLSRRPWMGVYCDELEGQVRVTRVSEDSPADVAGLQPGDRILRVDGAEVHGLESLWKSLWTGGPPEREVTLEIARGDEQPQTLKVQAVDRLKALRHAQGI